ncbi:unnamed protein product [Spirodela intermedia]|uniref:Uncharacterized protein n=1 Tax=Spirodela intermedia TaxID=51605 RepID=A0A7I8KQE6_SPIIN|nr:unnamed protein product [Spirodela intermedia]
MLVRKQGKHKFMLWKQRFVLLLQIIRGIFLMCLCLRQ